MPRSMQSLGFATPTVFSTVLVKMPQTSYVTRVVPAPLWAPGLVGGLASVGAPRNPGRRPIGVSFPKPCTAARRDIAPGKNIANPNGRCAVCDPDARHIDEDRPAWRRGWRPPPKRTLDEGVTLTREFWGGPRVLHRFCHLPIGPGHGR